MKKIRKASQQVVTVTPRAGAKAFAKECSFEIDKHQVHFHYFFKGSYKRKGTLAEYLDFVNLECEKSVFLSRVQGGFVDNG